LLPVQTENLPRKAKPVFLAEDGRKTASIRLHPDSGFPDGDFHNLSQQISVTIGYSPFYLPFPKLYHKDFGVSLFENPINLKYLLPTGVSF
jgi:hypothetical protein